MKNINNKIVRCFVAAVTAGLALVGCGGGNTDFMSVSFTYKVGGTVSGLVAPGELTLQNNGRDDRIILENGSFNFATDIQKNSSYALTVKTQPTGQLCSVTGAGTGSSATDVSNLQVSCMPSSVTVAVNVSGNADVQGVAMAKFSTGETIPGDLSTFVGLTQIFSGNEPLVSYTMVGGQAVLGTTAGTFSLGDYGLVVLGAPDSMSCNRIGVINATTGIASYRSTSPNHFTQIIGTVRDYLVVPVTLFGGNAIVNIQCTKLAS